MPDPQIDGLYGTGQAVQPGAVWQHVTRVTAADKPNRPVDNQPPASPNDHQTKALQVANPIQPVTPSLVSVESLIGVKIVSFQGSSLIHKALALQIYAMKSTLC
ncbi:hypothetical protein G8764_09955 [Pseudomaricurvus alcaniphilus]|uniref:hypothetical protein n=1 Tax=Pseudomaricurvus alcaniphilus TaxID=1166482 RepID=UPI0014090866|nr:hypothetical protein [Pseudomaricurvus alcaniphilus]NHN37616.1 hypothetical protein [Pseudomaricurvus alcaniphilus]